MYQRPQLATTSDQDSIRWADWIELNVLTQEENSLSIEDVTATIAKDPPDNSGSSEHRLDYDDDYGYWQIAEQTAESAFSELQQRSRWYGGRYPLDVNNNFVTAASGFDSSIVAKFLTLLRARHLYQHALGDNGNLPGQLFEELLPHVLRRLLGTSCDTAVRFGVAGGNRGDGLPIETDKALDELALRMKEPRGTLANLNNGWDYGVDSVAWKPLGDSMRGKLTAIGQATITERVWWTEKKRPSPKWQSGRLIRLFTLPTTVVAFVESISLTSNTMLDGLFNSFPTLPLDRFRILFVLRDQDVPTALIARMSTWSTDMLDRLRQ